MGPLPIPAPGGSGGFEMRHFSLLTFQDPWRSGTARRRSGSQSHIRSTPDAAPAQSGRPAVDGERAGFHQDTRRSQHSQKVRHRCRRFVALLKRGNFPVGEMARNQSGLAFRSTLIRSNDTIFSRRAMAERCTNGHNTWLTRVRSKRSNISPAKLVHASGDSTLLFSMLAFRYGHRLRSGLRACSIAHSR